MRNGSLWVWPAYGWLQLKRSWRWVRQSIAYDPVVAVIIVLSLLWVLLAHHPEAGSQPLETFPSTRELVTAFGLLNPFVTYLLLMLGVYGVLFEVLHPGSSFPGAVGALCLVLGLLGVQGLGLKWLGVAVIFLGAGLMAWEVLFPALKVNVISGGWLWGGVLFQAIGTWLLLDVPDPMVVSARPVLEGVGAVMALTMVVIIGRIRQTLVSKALSPLEKLMGEVGRITAPLPAPGQAGTGKILVYGETWDARWDVQPSSASLAGDIESQLSTLTSDWVRVTGIHRQPAHASMISPPDPHHRLSKGRNCNSGSWVLFVVPVTLSDNAPS